MFCCRMNYLWESIEVLNLQEHATALKRERESNKGLSMIEGGNVLCYISPVLGLSKHLGEVYASCWYI